MGQSRPPRLSMENSRGLREWPSECHPLFQPQAVFSEPCPATPRDTLSGCKGRTSNATSHDSAWNACSPAAGVSVPSLWGVSTLTRTLGPHRLQDPYQTTARRASQPLFQGSALLGGLSPVLTRSLLSAQNRAGHDGETAG